MPSTLSSADRATFESIFRHPVAHNLEWRSLIAVFNHIGELEEEANGKMKFSRNGQSLILHSRGKDVEVEELMHIRRFLESTNTAEEPKQTLARDVLVVLDHSGARIFRADAEEAIPEHVVPLDPQGHDQQVHNPKGDSGGQQGPHRKQFYEALAKKLEGADRILLMGDGQGASSEMDRFVAELHENRNEALAERISASEVANISHMTDGEFAARAKSFFTRHTNREG
ncbi:hypothetical protein [Fimbriimonas ginsengisoli]|uniref:Uncharacterized protein n=1 Tax=Fimbriimonas ginsengisoli Gsoil 348 TaxID=661478 RepID=A0A068NR26_FIMGI|nr:hypothetical protein [Fimbriimonas ginsengisoli]AIE85837.1 hypothetical protein OP10G_2469 [Fimbriimonas ginsengisoli Gsoil 348]